MNAVQACAWFVSAREASVRVSLVPFAFRAREMRRRAALTENHIHPLHVASHVHLLLASTARWIVHQMLECCLQCDESFGCSVTLIAPPTETGPTQTTTKHTYTDSPHTEEQEYV